MREIDRLTTERYGIPSLELMENAATAVARFVTDSVAGEVAGKAVLVFCGKGNNGGDGAAVARLLASAGARIDVVIFGPLEETKCDDRVNLDRLRSWNEEIAVRGDQETSGSSLTPIRLFECESERGWEQLLATILKAPHDFVIDALLGTGLTRPVEGTYQSAVRYLARMREDRETPPHQSARIISIDIPSGLNADSEKLIGDAVPADATVTMTAPKLANVMQPAAEYNGKLIVAGIGSPPELIGEAKLSIIEQNDARHWLLQTRYRPDSYKNIHGHALIIAGSRGFTGAAALCGNAAMRA